MTPLRVFYGYAILNNTIKQKAMRVIFENERHNGIKNDAFIKKALHVVHVRLQTEREMEDSKGCTRIFSCYEKFIDKLPFKGNIDKLLQFNFDQDSENVSIEEREEIRLKMRKTYFEFYGVKQETELIKKPI